MRTVRLTERGVTAGSEQRTGAARAFPLPAGCSAGARTPPRRRPARHPGRPGTPTVPVRPLPPLRATSTRSIAARCQRSARACWASAGSAGSRQSIQRSYRDGHATAGGGVPCRYNANCGRGPGGSGCLNPRPRTSRTEGRSTPGADSSHASTSGKVDECGKSRASATGSTASGRSVGAVDVSSVLDAQHDDLAGLVS